MVRPTCYVENEDGTRTWYAETLDGSLMRFEFIENGSRHYFIDQDRVEAAAMMETFAPDEPGALNGGIRGAHRSDASGPGRVRPRRVRR